MSAQRPAFATAPGMPLGNKRSAGIDQRFRRRYTVMSHARQHQREGCRSEFRGDTAKQRFDRRPAVIFRRFLV